MALAFLGITEVSVMRTFVRGGDTGVSLETDTTQVTFRMHPGDAHGTVRWTSLLPTLAKDVLHHF